MLCILKNDNDPTTKLLNKLKVNYENVKDIYMTMNSDSDDILKNNPKAEHFDDSGDEGFKDSGAIHQVEAEVKQQKNRKLLY